MNPHLNVLYSIERLQELDERDGKERVERHQTVYDLMLDWVYTLENKLHQMGTSINIGLLPMYNVEKNLQPQLKEVINTFSVNQVTLNGDEINYYDMVASQYLNDLKPDILSVIGIGYKFVEYHIEGINFYMTPKGSNLGGIWEATYYIMAEKGVI